MKQNTALAQPSIISRTIQSVASRLSMISGKPKDEIVPELVTGVSGHPKPTSDGHLKTSHLDGVVCRLGCPPKGGTYAAG